MRQDEYAEAPQEGARVGREGGKPARRVSWTIRDRAKAIAERAAGSDSQSAYVSTLIEQRAAEWQGALDYLVERGWTKSAIETACEGLEAAPAWTPRPLAAVRPAVDGEITESEARAFLLLAREWWAGNAELRERL